MIGCLQTLVHKQPIIALYFESETVLKFYNLETRSCYDFSIIAYDSRHMIKVRKKAEIMNQYNQVPHLTQDAIWESDKNTRKHQIQRTQEGSPFPASDHKAARNRQDSMAKTNTDNKKDPQKKHCLGKYQNLIVYFTGEMKQQGDQSQSIFQSE